MNAPMGTHVPGEPAVVDDNDAARGGTRHRPGYALTHTALLTPNSVPCT
jgi:hypothetical protein